jgi:hypothetical protein
MSETTQDSTRTSQSNAAARFHIDDLPTLLAELFTAATRYPYGQRVFSVYRGRRPAFLHTLAWTGSKFCLPWRNPPASPRQASGGPPSDSMESLLHTASL